MNWLPILLNKGVSSGCLRSGVAAWPRESRYFEVTVKGQPITIRLERRAVKRNSSLDYSLQLVASDSTGAALPIAKPKFLCVKPT